MSNGGSVTVSMPSLDGIDAVDDAGLFALAQRWTQARRVIDAGLATLAGQIAARSSAERGYDGLAQRFGARTPDALVSRLTGASNAEAGALVTVGRMLTGEAPWLAPVVERIADGRLTVGSAAAIRRGLGEPTAAVAADELGGAVALLIDEAGSLPPEKVARRSRELRDELDAVGVADRERMLRDRRFLRLTPQDDGMTRIHGLLDPESAALVTDALDLVTAPRRGGPRFAAPGEVERARRIVDDPRTTPQLALDAFVELIRIAGAADPERLLGAREPAVRVHVAASDLATGDGFAWIEGQTAAVSLAAVERLACASGFLPILFDEHDRPLRLGRTQRLFSAAQRTALAARWGGCVMPGCDRPPAWTEAHHIDEWHRDHGATDVDDGVLLCRHHHMLVHDNGWRVRRRGGEYELVPPPDDPLHPAPIGLVPRNPIRDRVRRRHRRALAAGREPVRT